MGIFKRETAEPEPAEAEVEAEAEAEVEGEIRELVRHEVAGAPRREERTVDAVSRRQDNDGTLVADNLSSLLQRVSASSIQEIDALIDDLKILREKLQDDGRRVQRQIVQYASLSQSAMQSTKAIAESLGHWKRRGPGASGNGEAS